jgi:hypothetical protein
MQHGSPAKSPEMALPPANENALNACENPSMMHLRQMQQKGLD